MSRCQMKFCARRSGAFCYDCNTFPCDALQHLDKRYRSRYSVSPIANLEFIRDFGLEAFLQRQSETWAVEGGIRCMHDGVVYPVRQG